MSSIFILHNESLNDCKTFMKIVSKFELDFFPRQILYQSENILSDIEILHSSNIFMHSYTVDHHSLEYGPSNKNLFQTMGVFHTMGGFI